MDHILMEARFPSDYPVRPFLLRVRTAAPSALAKAGRPVAAAPPSTPQQPGPQRCLQVVSPRWQWYTGGQSALLMV